MRDTFIRNLYRKAREYEVLDINNSRKSFIRRNGRYMLSTLVALIVLFTLPCGYTQEFLQLASTILSIFIGLLLTVLVFALDKFYGPDRLGAKDYSFGIYENGDTRNVEVSIDEIRHPDAHDKLWHKKSWYYVSKFNVLVGKNVVVAVFALVLLCLNVMYYGKLNEDITGYVFIYEININTVLTFLWLAAIVCLRFMICYLIIEVFYNTIGIISSMVNFMSVKIGRK